jgi:ubiquinone/menaquinone biosynthesis C-methylase UbiE
MSDVIHSIRESYDRVADEYTRHIFDELQSKPLDRAFLDRFAAETAGIGRVCDIGCGPGHVARYLHQAGVTVFGLDLSTGMLEQARKLDPEIRFTQGNMLGLELADESLAGIVAFYSIVHLPQDSLPQAFCEMERVLQPGGRLLLAFHMGNEVIQLKELWGQPVSLDFFFFEPAIIQREMESSGLRIEEVIERAPYAPEVEYQSRRAYIFARKPDPRR